MIQPSYLGRFFVLFFMKALAKVFRTDLLTLAYNNLGVLNFGDGYLSGELFVVEKILPKLFTDNEEIVLFDVGANIGSYSLELRKIFKKARVYSFEPNPNAYTMLKENLQGRNCNCLNLGLGAEKQRKTLYTYSTETQSEHSSCYKEVFLDVHKVEDHDILEINVLIDTLDEFCGEENVQQIDFLKIDTEGYEYEVLKGGVKMISEGRINIIQFEFNEMNVTSRVFLKDFFHLLNDYQIYRLRPNNLLPLTTYDTSLEIFKFQNLLAIHKKFRFSL